MAVYDKNGKVIKSAVDCGWEVDSSDVPKALDMWVEYVGEDNALEDIARAMDDDTLIENVEWIAQQWGIGEEVEEERTAWDKYEKAKELMGVHKLFTNLTQAAGYDELAEDLAYIFRMNDFRQWDDMEVYSSRKSIKSGINDKMIYKSDDDKYSIYLSDCRDANHGEDPHLEYELAIDGRVQRYVRDDDLNYEDILEKWKDWYNLKPVQSSRKPIKSSFNYYDGFESDVSFYAEQCDDDDIVEYVAGKIEDDGHPTESPEEFDSLMRAVHEELKRQGYFKQPWQVNSSKKNIKSSQIKSGIEIYKGAKFKNPNGSVIEIVRKDDDGYVLFKTYDGRIRDTTEESAKRMLQFNQYTPIESSKKNIKSSKEEKADPNDPHMKFKKLDEDYKMDLREDIEDELEALLKKLHVKFDLETWNETVDYILSFFEEDNFYNPKDAKQAVHEWYLDTKDEFPDMFDSKKTKIASSAYREFIHNKMSIKSTHNLIKSSVEEEDPVEVLLKDAAQQLGATYKEGWWGKGIQEGDGRWNGGKWAVLVDTDTYGRPTVQFKADKSGYSEGHITPMNCKTADVEPFPQNLVAWIEDKISDAESERGDWKSIVEKFENVDAKEIDYVEDNPSKKQILVKLDTEDTDKATDLAQWINGQVGNEDGNFQVYDLWEILEDKYEDLDPEVRDEKVVIFYFND